MGWARSSARDPLHRGLRCEEFRLDRISLILDFVFAVPIPKAGKAKKAKRAKKSALRGCQPCYGPEKSFGQDQGPALHTGGVLVLFTPMALEDGNPTYANRAMAQKTP